MRKDKIEGRAKPREIHEKTAASRFFSDNVQSIALGTGQSQALLRLGLTVERAPADKRSHLAYPTLNHWE